MFIPKVYCYTVKLKFEIFFFFLATYVPCCFNLSPLRDSNQAMISQGSGTELGIQLDEVDGSTGLHL